MQSSLIVGPFAIDPTNACSVHIHGTRLHLTAKETQILLLLVRAHGEVVLKSDLMSALCGEQGGWRDSNIINVFICKLRKKIAAATGGQPYIENVWGRGYRIKTDATEHSLVAQTA